MELRKRKATQEWALLRRKGSRDTEQSLRKIVPHPNKKRKRRVHIRVNWDVLKERLGAIFGGLLMGILVLVLSIIIPILLGGY